MQPEDEKQSFSTSIKEFLTSKEFTFKVNKVLYKNIIIYKIFTKVAEEQ